MLIDADLHCIEVREYSLHWHCRCRGAEYNVLRLFFVSGHGDLESCEVNVRKGKRMAALIPLCPSCTTNSAERRCRFFKHEEETEHKIMIP